MLPSWGTATYNVREPLDVRSEHSLEFPPSDGLGAFLAAARNGSFSSAAREIGVTHAAVSRRIQAMEQWAGARLFERHGRGVRLTEVGEHLAKTAEHAFTQVAMVASDARKMHSRTRVRLSVLPSLARLWLMPRIVDLEGDPGDITLQVNTEHRVAIVDGRDADLAIRYGNGAWSGVHSTLLLRECFFPVASPAVAGRLAASSSLLTEETLLHDTDSGDWRRWLAFAGIPYRPTRGERFFVDYDIALLAAEAGLGVALGRMPLVTEALEQGRLVRLSAPVMESDRGHFLVSRPMENRPAVLRLMARLRAHSDLMRGDVYCLGNSQEHDCDDVGAEQNHPAVDEMQ